MFIHMSIHKPRPEKEQLLVSSMHRFGAAIVDHHGLRQVLTTKDDNTGLLVGIAIWDSKAAWEAAVPAMAAAVEDDPFDDWEEEPPQVFYLTPV